MTASTRYAIGIDSGNSKTLVVVGDETGEVLGVARTGSGNHQAVGLAGAMRNVQLAIERAMAGAGLSVSAVAASFYALAGADLAEDFELLRPAVHDLGVGKVIGLDNDSAASLRSGTDNPDAVVVGWGSGVNGMGHNAAGQTVRLPALGEISGDWGGGDDLARESIRLVARAYDGRGRDTALTDLVLGALGASSVDEMIRKLYLREVDMDALRTIPPLLFRAANKGDAVACSLVGRAAEEIAVTAAALLRRLGLSDAPADVVLGGSVFRAEGTLLVDTVVAHLEGHAPRARVVLPNVEPAVGAYFCALDLLGISIDAGMRDRARRSYERVAGHAAMKVRR